MEGHEERAAELEYELAEMEEQQEKVDAAIHAAKDDWEAKKRDDSVSGAGTGEPAQGEGPDPEVTGGGPGGGGSPEIEDEKA
jgi:hypothetical protein